MSAAKKLNPEVSTEPALKIVKPGDEVGAPVPAAEIPLWRQKKNTRQKLLRAIRAKAFSETVRTVIRSEIKKPDGSKDT